MSSILRVARTTMFSTVCSAIFLMLSIASCTDDNSKETEATIVWEKDFSAKSSFKYLYPSTDANGKKIILSAIAFYPKQVSSVTGLQIMPQNMIIGCHVTITDNASCPSNQFDEPRDSDLSDALIISSLAEANDDTTNVCCNNLVILPDYQGYGETADMIHPYLCNELTAKQVVDAAHYGMLLLGKKQWQAGEHSGNFHLSGNDWKTVIIGYSQGGAIAMATHKYIEDNNLDNEFHLQGSICGDGPYSLNTTFQSYLKQNHITMVTTAPLIVDGMIVGNNNMAGEKPEKYLSDKLLSTGIQDWISSKEYSTTDIETMLYNTGFTDKSVENIYDSTLISSFNKGTENQEFPLLVKSLKDNEMTNGWSTSHRIWLFHSADDDVVPADNAYRYLNNNYTDRSGLVKTTIVNGMTHSDAGTEFFARSFGMLQGIYSSNANWMTLGDDYKK